MMSFKKDVHNDIEDKIPNITNLATNASRNTKINKIKAVIPNIANLATTTALTAVENKDVTSNKNESYGLSKKVKAISTKGLTKDLINKFSTLNGAKYFSLGTFQN